MIEFKISHDDALESLTDDQRKFIEGFVMCKGNLRDLGMEQNKSYYLLRKELDDISGILRENKNLENNYQVLNLMKSWNYPEDTNKASEAVKNILKKNSGILKIPSINKEKMYKIYALSKDSKIKRTFYRDINLNESFTCDVWNSFPPCQYDVFDYIIDYLKRHDNKAQKGSPRNNKLGERGCDDNTIIGYLGSKYFNKTPGTYIFDIMPVLSAIMNYCGITNNENGTLVLTENWANKIKQK